jgi:exodeoxyribonuclease-3
MKIFALNIRQGGGSRLSALLARLPDVDALVLSEYRDSENGKILQRHLLNLGFDSIAFDKGSVRNGVLVAVKGGGEVTAQGQRLCAIDFRGLRVCGVYMPQNEAKRPVYEMILREYANGARETIMIGDFNTGRKDLDISEKRTFYCLDMFAQLEERMIEAWRHLHPETREYSWFSRGHKTGLKIGWRIDHAFISPSLLSRLVSCEYDHRFRASGLTDHSGMLLELGDPA